MCLKLYWRTNTETAPSEDEIYKTLYEARVPNIARPLSGGAFVDEAGKTQRTLTEMYWDSEHAKSRPPVKWELYYMVTEDLGRPLESFENQTVVVNCILDAVDGTLCPPPLIVRARILIIQLPRHSSPRRLQCRDSASGCQP